MMIKLAIFAIGLVSLGLAEMDYCPENVKELAINCNFVAATFIYQTKTLGTEKGVSIERYNQTCATLQACTRILSCGMDSDDERLSNAIQMGYECQAFVFLKGEFDNCYGQLVEKSSECFSGYDALKPFEAMDGEVESACNDFFGKDNCLEEEITETCGQDEWEKYKKYFNSINVLRFLCDKKYD